MNCDDNLWQIEAMQIPPSPRASPELFPVDAISSWSMLNGSHDRSVSLSGPGHLQQDTTDGLAMTLDFDIDDIFSMPGILSSGPRSLDASPTDMTIEMGQQPVLGAQQSVCSSAVFFQNISHAQPSPPTQTRSKKTSSSSQSALTDHHCTANALRVLGVSMAGPKTQVTIEDLLRSLVKLARCSMCTECSPFLVLMVININALLDAVDNALKLLKDHNIGAEASVWIQYGVDTAVEFGRMYSPLLLPIVGAVRTVISEIYQVCLTQDLQPQLDQLDTGQRRLGLLEVGLQDLL